MDADDWLKTIEKTSSRAMQQQRDGFVHLTPFQGPYI
jgi:hypothetical protein